MTCLLPLSSAHFRQVILATTGLPDFVFFFLCGRSVSCVLSLSCSLARAWPLAHSQFRIRSLFLPPSPSLMLTLALSFSLLWCVTIRFKALSKSPLELLTFHMIMRVYVCVYANAGKCVRVRMCVCVCLRVCVCVFVNDT